MNIKIALTPHPIGTARLRTILSLIVVTCGITVLNVWAFAHTIAARNICLVFGSLCGLLLLGIFRKYLVQPRFFCAYLLLGLIAWMGLHYLAWPVAPEIALKELSSTWLRVFLAVILGAALGLIVSRSKRMRSLTLLSFLLLPILYLCLYGISSLQAGQLPVTEFNGAFISTAGGTYFLMWPFLFTCACIDFLINRFSSANRESYSLMKLSLLTCILFACFAAFYFLRSLNGLLIASFFIIVLVARITITCLIHGRFIKSGFICITLILAAAAFSLHTYGQRDGGKLNNILTDFEIATQIDLHPNWRNYANGSWVPAVPDGRTVNQSTYYRIANAIAGVRIIQDHPLGAGFTYLPYGFYLSRIYPGSTSDHTHSGWVDFALGVGIPGLVLCWGAIILTLIIGFNQISGRSSLNLPQTLWPYVTVWGLGGITLLWIVLEVSEKEYIEHLFFMISFLGAGNAPISSNTALKIS